MLFDLSTLIQYLNAVSAIAVITGVTFVVFQLRQNAKLIEASNKQIETANRQAEASIQQNRQQVILSLVDRFTDESLTLRRKRVREIVKKYAANNWEGFHDSDDDYDVRAFIAHYESTGYLARVKIVDVKTIQEAMGSGVIYDWGGLEPAVKHYREIWKIKIFENFEWLKDSVVMEMKENGVDPRTSFV
ncbi:MAG: DUF4760 domain-containing protein [Thaumarchaeota archaeon]|nr:DUF4760 domain-containing protein [Nitrososphaerota archaeon]